MKIQFESPEMMSKKLRKTIEEMVESSTSLKKIAAPIESFLNKNGKKFEVGKGGSHVWIKAYRNGRVSDKRIAIITE
jgi:hypothetical protein